MTPNQPQQPPPHPDREQVEQAAAALAELGHQVVAAFQHRRREQGRAGNAGGRRSVEDRSGLSIWALGLIPVVLACLHLIMVSRGNAETLRSLVQNLNVTALVLATTLPLGTTLLTWWFVFSAFGRSRPGKPKNALSLIVAGVFVAFIDFFAMPLGYGAINLGIVVALILCVAIFALVAKLRRRPVDPEPESTDRIGGSGCCG